MASDNDASCASDPNFAVICSFLDCFGKSCGIEYPDIALLQEMVENAQEVPQQLIDLHVKLLRKTRKTVTIEKWERALVKFCHTYSNQDGWELERFGYKKARVAVKLRLLKVLLEAQFDSNQRFKNEVNKLAANELRVEPLGRDKTGLAYWCQLDEECNIRVYREDLDEESWELVAKDRDGVVSLITTLSNGEAGDIALNEEDSNSLEISEKPIIDTGQVTTSPSLDDDQKEDAENGMESTEGTEKSGSNNADEINDQEANDEPEQCNGHSDNNTDTGKLETGVKKKGTDEQDNEDDEDSEDRDLDEEEDEDEDEMDDEDISNEEAFQENTEDDDTQDQTIPPLQTSARELLPERNHARSLNLSNAVDSNAPSIADQQGKLPPNPFAAEPIHANPEVKHIETPVIKTSPIKLINIKDLTKPNEELTPEIADLKVPMGITLTTVTKPKSPLEEPVSKSNIFYSPNESKLAQNKISVKPIDKLSLSFGKQPDKSAGNKSLEQIAENLARNSGSAALSVHHGAPSAEDDRMQSDFFPRAPMEQPPVALGHRGMDLSTSPRGWETAGDPNRQLPLSGIDLSSRKGFKVDLTPAGYRNQDFQHREIDLSTRKAGKSEIPNLPYDARMAMRGHPMVADLSKRPMMPQVGYPSYELPPAYHASRLPGVDERRMANYGMHPDPSKMNPMRMGGISSVGSISGKRNLEEDDVPRDILKRIRADVIPIKSTLDKRQIPTNKWRDEVGEATEEPLMMVHGEGSGSDCDAVNPGIGEAIDEPVMFFYGEGDGRQCETGNPADDSSTDKDDQESKTDDKISLGTRYTNEATTNKSVSLNDTSSNVNNFEPGTSTVDSEKIKFKPTLGVQIFAKSTGTPVKRTSRWDVGKPVEQDSKPSHDQNATSQPPDESIEEGSSRVADTSEIASCSAAPENCRAMEPAKPAGGCDASETSEPLGTIETTESRDPLPSTELEKNTQFNKVSETSAAIDTLPRTDSSEPVAASESGNIDVDQPSSTSDVVSGSQIERCDMDSTRKPVPSSSEDSPRKTDLPIEKEASPPRFFFGPNCFSYATNAKTSGAESVAESEATPSRINASSEYAGPAQISSDDSLRRKNPEVDDKSRDTIEQPCNEDASSDSKNTERDVDPSQRLTSVDDSANCDNTRDIAGAVDESVRDTSNATTEVLTAEESMDTISSEPETPMVTDIKEANDSQPQPNEPDDSVDMSENNIPPASEKTDSVPEIGEKSAEGLVESIDKTVDEDRMDLPRSESASLGGNGDLENVEESKDSMSNEASIVPLESDVGESETALSNIAEYGEDESIDFDDDSHAPSDRSPHPLDERAEDVVDSNSATSLCSKMDIDPIVDNADAIDNRIDPSESMSVTESSLITGKCAVTEELSKMEESNVSESSKEIEESGGSKKLSEIDEPEAAEKLAELVEPEVAETMANIEGSEVDERMAEVKKTEVGDESPEIKESDFGEKLAESNVSEVTESGENTADLPEAETSQTNRSEQIESPISTEELCEAETGVNLEQSIRAEKIISEAELSKDSELPTSSAQPEGHGEYPATDSEKPDVLDSAPVLDTFESEARDVDNNAPKQNIPETEIHGTTELSLDDESQNSKVDVDDQDEAPVSTHIGEICQDEAPVSPRISDSVAGTNIVPESCQDDDSSMVIDHAKPEEEKATDEETDVQKQPEKDAVIATEFAQSSGEKHIVCSTEAAVRSPTELEANITETTEAVKSYENRATGAIPSDIIEPDLSESLEKITVQNEKDVRPNKIPECSPFVEYQDTASADASSFDDQDSNEPMVIDDGAYDSTNSPKEQKFDDSNLDAPESLESNAIIESADTINVPEKSSDSLQQPIIPDQQVPESCTADTESDNNAKIVETESDSTDLRNTNDAKLVHSEILSASKKNLDSEQNAEELQLSRKDESVPATTSSDIEKRPVELDDVDSQLDDGGELEEETEDVAAETESLDQKSLVANYDSNDSCDRGSDDVFENEVDEFGPELSEELADMGMESPQPEDSDQDRPNDVPVAATNVGTEEHEAQIHLDGKDTEPESSATIDENDLVESFGSKSNPPDTIEGTLPEKLAEADPVDAPKLQIELTPELRSTELTTSQASIEPLVASTAASTENLNVTEETLSAERLPEVAINSADTESQSSTTITDKSSSEVAHEIPISDNLYNTTIVNARESEKELESIQKSAWLSNTGKQEFENKTMENLEIGIADKPSPGVPCSQLPPIVTETVDTVGKKHVIDVTVAADRESSKDENEFAREDEPPIIHVAKRLKEDASLTMLDDKQRTISDLVKESGTNSVESNLGTTDRINHVTSYNAVVEAETVQHPEIGSKVAALDRTDNESKSVMNSLSNRIDEVNKPCEMTDESSTVPEEHKPVEISEKVDDFDSLIDDSHKEASKRQGDVSNLDDIPPIKSKPVVDDPTETEKSQNEVSVDERGDAEETNEQIKTSALGDTTTEAASDIQSIDVKVITVESDDSMGANNDFFDNAQDETDPLAGTEDDGSNKAVDVLSAASLGIRVKPVSTLVYEGWKLDSTETPKVCRKRRNSNHESNSEDVIMRDEDEESEGTGGKRMRLRGKRTPDMDLRRSVEEKREEAASSDDEISNKVNELPNKDSTLDDDVVIIEEGIPDKKRGRPRGRRKARRNARGIGRPISTRNVHAVPSSQPTMEIDEKQTKDPSGLDTPMQKKRKKRKMVLGLEIGRDIIDTSQPGAELNEMPVRQSRRIAQLKIKEEADRRRVEEETLSDLKEKKERDVVDKKKRKKQKGESEEEISSKEIERESKKKKKRRKKKKKNLSKFDETNPWRSSSGSCTEDDEDNEEEEEEEEEMESEGSVLFKSDHEFSPESDLEKDDESQPLRRARTAQKAQSDDEEADDEYACQKCGKADHPEWILLCDTCDKGWHCSCLRPALMLIPEGDWFCPPCQHNLLVTKLQDSLKTFDQYTKRHENELLRKKRLAFVGISLDNVLHKNDAHKSHRSSRGSSPGSDNDSSSSASSSSSSDSSATSESEPVYQLRERRCANTYKFNEYDDMINAAIGDEVKSVRGAGNQGRGKDIATIVNAEKEEAQAEALKMSQGDAKDEEDEYKNHEKESDEDYKEDEVPEDDDEYERPKAVARKMFSRKKHRKLNSLDISSEDDPESDEDFKGSSSDEDEDVEEQGSSSDDSFADSRKQRGRRGGAPVRRSTRARMTRYDEDFINDDSDDSDRPKRKKSRSVWDDSESEESDNSWTQRKKRNRPIPTPKSRSTTKSKGKKKKKKKRIIVESDNQSENEDEVEQNVEKFEAAPETAELKVDLEWQEDTNRGEMIIGGDDVQPKTENNEAVGEENVVPPSAIVDKIVIKKKKENTPKRKKSPPLRRKIVYGGLQDDSSKQEEESLGRRTRGRKINYQEVLASDSEEELKKALKKTEESEDEFVINDVEDPTEEVEKDSDSGDIYSPKKETPKLKGKSPKGKKPRASKSPAAKAKSNPCDGDAPKPRRKPGPKPGSKNKPRTPKSSTPMMTTPGATPTLSSIGVKSAGEEEDVTEEGSLAGLGAGELAELDEEQLDQMMMEDEEYGKRQLELAAIEIAKKKKKEEREAKKLEKARLKALEILAAERQRDPNAPDGTDGEAPKKKKRGRRSKAEILAEQMRRDGAPDLSLNSPSATTISTSESTTVSPSCITPNVTPTLNATLNANLQTFVNPSLSPNLVQNLTPSLVPGSNLSTTITQSEAQKIPENLHPVVTGADGHLGYSPDPGILVKPKRRGRGKGKKTLALEAARAAEAAAKAASDHIVSGFGTDSNPEMKSDDLPLPTPGSSSSSAPSTPPSSVPGVQLTSPNQSVNQAYPSMPPGQQSSVITRMLQSQPVAAGGPQSFTAAAAAMGHKYFGGPNAAGNIMGVPRPGFDIQPRGRIPSPYRQSSQSPMPPHFAVRSGTPSMRMRVPGPQMYHTPHHPMDPSPSGGGPISITSRDRSSPLGPGSAMIPPAAGSPLSKGGPTPPPPPPYARGAPPMGRFSETSPMGPRHQMPPFTNASGANHALQQPSPPPNRPPGNFSPYHPPPPNYHYGAYPPPPPMTTADDAAAYQTSPYPSEHFSTPSENPAPIPAPPQSQQPQPQTHPGEGPPGNKQFDEEGSGEFGGLVSYFSSQREDDLDS